jgi:hypothetical protein
MMYPQVFRKNGKSCSESKSMISVFYIFTDICKQGNKSKINVNWNIINICVFKIVF